MAESHFYALFRQQTGLSPHQYLLIKRLEQAKQLLIEPHFCIQQIAQLCGFASQSSFTTAFNRHFSLTPARFRRQFH
jgi:AraC-like DNA-binding protein